MSAAVAGRAAGFGQRALAWCVDLLVLTPMLAWLAWPPLVRSFAAATAWLAQVQGWMLERMLSADTLPSPLAVARSLLDDPVQGVAARAAVMQLSAAVMQACLAVAAVAAVYFVVFESSRWQATPGKRLLGLRVETIEGERLTPLRALGRHVAGAASWLTLNLGHALVALRPDRRALHDLIVGTRVSASRAMPAWGRAALAALVGLAVLAPVWGMLHVLGQLAG